MGEGSFRQVFPNRRNRNEVIKLPNMGGQQMTNIAAMDALAQLGYPVMPETPVLAYKIGGTVQGPYPGTTQPRANAVVSDEKARLSNDPDTTWQEQTDFQNQFRDTVRHPLITYGPIQDPLMQAIGVTDVREANTGIYDDGMKAIDFEVMNLGAHREPTYDENGQKWASTMPRLKDWLKVPDEQRRSFINIYGDTSRFEPWNDARNPRTGYLGTQEELYRRGLRNLQLMNDMIDNPEQRRLFEFVGEEEKDRGESEYYWGQKLGAQKWRDMIQNREPVE